MSLRIAQITRDYSPNGGVAVYVRDVVGALQLAGHEVTVIHADRGAAPGPAVATTFVDRCTDFEAPREATAAALEALERDAPDVVHIQGNNNFHLEAELRRRYPSVKTLHVYDFCPSGNKYHHALARACQHPTGFSCVPRMVYKRCLLDKRPSVIWHAHRRAVAANLSNATSPALLVASEYVRRSAIATGYPPAQVRTLPYFTVPPPAPPPPGHGDTVFFSGRIVREKGLHVLLAALARVARPWRLLVAGDGMDRLRAARIARRLGVADRVTFLGWLDRAGVAHRLAEAAVVAVPSLWPEPFGIAGLEAMAHARPVVAFAVGGIPEWLSDGETGFLVPPGDIGAMADRLTRLLDDPSLAASLGAHARERVARDFSLAYHVEHLLAVYSEVIAAGERSMPLARGDGP